MRTVLFTASQRREGCSTIASNLAIYLSRIQPESVLLAEFNVAHPARRPVVPADRVPGLMDLVSGDGSLGDAIHSTAVPNLHVLGAGRLDAPLLPPAALSAILAKLKSSFGYVIIDGPVVSDATFLSGVADHCDGVLLVTRANRTRQAVAARSVRDLREAGAPLLGMVLNRRRYFIPGWLYRSL